MALKETTNDLEMPEFIVIQTDQLRDGVDGSLLNPKNINRLPVTSVVPTYTAKEGTYILYDNGVDTRALYTMLGGVWYSTTLT